jgi:site-specific recombinase XerD
VVRVLGDKTATSVTTLDLRRVIVESPERTAPNNYHFMRRLFRFMLEEGIIRTNPMEKVRPPKIEQKITQAHTQDEIQNLYKTAKTLRGYAGLRDAVIFALLVGTGIRREELCSLKDDDVNLVDGIMLIRGKGRKQRLVPIPIHLRKMMAHYQTMRKGTKVADRKCDRFFRSRNGVELRPQALTLMIKRLGQTAGIKTHPHKLRHTFATHYMSNDGADIMSLQAICGWSTLAMPVKYAKASMPKLQRSMDSFSPSCE